MKTQTILQLLCAMVIAVILLGIIFYKGLITNVPVPEVKHDPIVTPHKNFNDYCDAHECLIGK